MRKDVVNGYCYFVLRDFLKHSEKGNRGRNQKRHKVFVVTPFIQEFYPVNM